MRNSEIENGIKAFEEYKSLEDRFDLIRSNIIDTWERSSALDRDAREILYHKLHSLNELKRSFIKDINTGKLAEVAENAGTKPND